MKTRPKQEEVSQRVNIPSFINGTTGKEYYVLNGADFNSPGKPLGVKKPNRFHKVDFDTCAAAIKVRS